MKTLHALIAGIAIAAASTTPTTAHAWSATCSLSVPSYIAVGQLFDFTVNLRIRNRPFPIEYIDPDFGPQPPFYGVFYGTKDGVNDIPSGYQHPSTFGQGSTALTGYGNPGGLGGVYTRALVIYDANDTEVCVTNSVTTTLAN
jgi:hypothetical protein